LSEARIRARLRAARELGLSEQGLAGRGVEFEVWRMRHPVWGEVAMRLPGTDDMSNENDPHVDPSALLRHEAAVYEFLAGSGVPVPQSYALVRGEVDVSVSEFIETDTGTPALDCFALGVLLARLHALPPMPQIEPGRAAEAFAATLAERVARRWSVLCRIDASLPAPPPAQQLAAVIPADAATSLIHLDIRAPNLLVRDGTIRALIDWTNSMIGDPALELARIEHYAPYPENGIDLPELLRGYATVRPLPQAPPPLATLYRLDVAVMLAVLFNSEVPDAVRGPQALAVAHHVIELWCTMGTSRCARQ
jgi:aminoglycoside phosphotransferase (APT) family kinase protein